MRSKHPAGDTQQVMQDAQQQADVVYAAATQRDADTDPAPAVFSADDVKRAIARSSANSAPGPSGLSFQHLQDMLRWSDGPLAADTLEHLAWLGNCMFATPQLLSDAFWALHTAARLSAVGAKARPIACGDTLRRLFSGAWCRKHRESIVKLLSAQGQYGVGVVGGAERVACLVETIAQADGVLLSLDARNAFNSISRAAVIRETAAHLPQLYPYVSRVYGSGRTARLLYAVPNTAQPAVVLSQQGVQQGDPLGPLLFALATLPVLTAFRVEHPHHCLPTYLDDMTVCTLPAGPSASSVRDSLVSTAAAYKWLAARLEPIGLSFNATKSLLRLPPSASLHAGLSDSTDEEYASMFGGARVSRDGIVVVGVPAGSEAFVTSHMQQALFSTGADALLASIAACRDTQLALALLRLCYITKATFLARNVAPTVAAAVLHRFDAGVLAAFAAVIQEPVLGVTSSADGEVLSDWQRTIAHIRADAWQGDCPVEFSAVQQAQIRLPLTHGGYGLYEVTAISNAAYVARTTQHLPHALRLLPAGQRLHLRHSLAGLPIMRATRAALSALTTTCGVGADHLSCALHSCWGDWLTDDEGSLSIVDTLLGLTDITDELQHSWSSAISPEDQLEPAVPASPVRHVQEFICAAQRDVDLQRYRAMLDGIPDCPQQQRDVCKARHLSQSSLGAMAFAACLPTLDEAFTMQSPLLREALRSGLGIDRPHAPDSRCPSCPGINSAQHARRCVRTGLLSVRHHLVCKSIVSGLQRMGLTGIRTEDCVPFVASTEPDKRIDFSIPGGQGLAFMRGSSRDRTAQANKTIIVDFSIVDPTGVTWLSHACNEQGYAAELRAREKHAHYTPHFPTNRYVLVPLAVEAFGAACKDTHHFIDAVAAFRSERSAGTWRKGSVVDWWRRRLSVAVQSAIAVAIDNSLSRSRTSGGVCLHASVHLLRSLTSASAGTVHSTTSSALPQGM